MANGPSSVNGDLVVAGGFSCQSMTIPANAVGDAQIPAAAGIKYSKLQQLRQIGYAQPNSAATTETREILAVRGATATVLELVVGAIVAAVGAATVTVDLRKNGVTILSAVVTLDSTTAAYILKSATILTPALVVGDVLTVVITATAGGGTLPTGFFVQVRVAEDAV